MKNVVIIPARGNSKELKKKSFKFLFKTPLILDYTASKKSIFKKHIYVSSESDHKKVM